MLILGGQATSFIGSQTWIRNFADPIRSLGHNVHVFDIDQFLLAKKTIPGTDDAKNLIASEFEKIIRDDQKIGGFNLCISYLHSGQVFPECLNIIRKKMYVVNYSTNFHQHRMYEEISKIADLNVYASHIARPFFDQLKVKSYHMPFAANSNIFMPSEEKSPDFLFIGSNYGRRPYIMMRLLQKNLNIRIYGPGWKQAKPSRSKIGNLRYIRQFLSMDTNSVLNHTDFFQKRIILQKLNEEYPGNLFYALTDELYAETMAKATLVINLNESRYDNDYLNPNVLLACNLRDFEVTASQTCLLTQYSDELPEYFRIGEEVLSYSNEYELIEKLVFLEKHRNLIPKIARQGFIRTSSEHTWENRFSRLFSYIMELY